MYKIVIYVPITHADKIRQALVEVGAGKIGDYEACSFSCRGLGRFRPIKEAKPFLGKIDEFEIVEEERIETICPVALLQDLLRKIKQVHPYEEPVLDVYSLVSSV